MPAHRRLVANPIMPGAFGHQPEVTIPPINKVAGRELANKPLHSQVHGAVKAMAPFAIRNLSVLAYAQGFTLWHYRAGNALIADATRPGFFDDAADMFADGDRIMVSGADGAVDLHVASHTTGRHAAEMRVAVISLQITHPTELPEAA